MADLHSHLTPDEDADAGLIEACLKQGLDEPRCLLDTLDNVDLRVFVVIEIRNDNHNLVRHKPIPPGGENLRSVCPTTSIAESIRLWIASRECCKSWRVAPAVSLSSYAVRA